MIYQHPLVYLLGMEGLALLRAYAGDNDREFVEARIAEIRRLLDWPAMHVDGVAADRVTTVDGYCVWSRTYDQPGNGLFAYEEPVVHEILDAVPPGAALDAACGTGRHTSYLAARGHRVIGVDSSPDMLRRARARVPQADFRLGDLHSLPLPDNHVDLVVCALALTHIADLRPPITEFVRVLRPGGHLVISDAHHLLIELGGVPKVRYGDGRPGLLPAYRHLASDYLDAALPLGLRPLRCAEPCLTAEDDSVPAGDGIEELAADDVGAPPVVGTWDDWPWSLLKIVPAAVRAVHVGTPAAIIWHFQLAGA